MELPQRQLKFLLEKWRFASPNNVESGGEKKSIWRRLYGYWMAFAKVLAKINTVLLLTLVYILVVGPVALVLKLLGKDLLDRRAEQRSSYWYDKLQEKTSLERSTQQF